jgi:cytochrome b561
MTQVTRYHPILVLLHWLLAFFIIMALAMGYFVMSQTPNSAPEKLEMLRGHMAGGMLILALMVLRFVVRRMTSHPPQATTGNAALDRLAPLTHYGFYVLVILMAGTGFATALAAGLPAIVFGNSGDPLPETFLTFPTRIAHGYIAAAIALLLALHVAAALYHQFVLKDSLFRRMFFGKRKD